MGTVARLLSNQGEHGDRARLLCRQGEHGDRCPAAVPSGGAWVPLSGCCTVCENSGNVPQPKMTDPGYTGGTAVTGKAYNADATSSGDWIGSCGSEAPDNDPDKAQLSKSSLPPRPGYMLVTYHLPSTLTRGTWCSSTEPSLNLTFTVTRDSLPARFSSTIS